MKKWEVRYTFKQNRIGWVEADTPEEAMQKIKTGKHFGETTSLATSHNEDTVKIESTIEDK